MAKFTCKLFTTLCCLLILSSGLSAQNKSRVISKRTNLKPGLQNQVSQFWFVMLTRGDDRSQDSITAATIQEGHMANINRLYKEGKLKVAGPFGDEGNWLGIFIFDCVSKDEVEKILITDPAIAAGRLKYEIHPWWTATVGSFKPGIPLNNK